MSTLGELFIEHMGRPPKEGELIIWAAGRHVKALRLESALNKLQHAEADYRYKHDQFGDGDIATGQAWDHMRRAGHNARELLLALEVTE